jgi:hypothetical protein
MTAKQLNMFLWILTAIFAISAAAVLLYAPLAPINHDMAIGASIDQPSTQSVASSRIPPPAAFDEIVRSTYRQPLGDPAPQSPEPTAPVASATPGTAASGLPVTLVGTVGNSLAMLKTLTNTVEVCAVGEMLYGVTVVAVRPSEVEVKFNGQTLTLSTPTEK